MTGYIEREAAVYEIEHDAPEQIFYSRNDAIDCIRALPAADVKPVRHGQWNGESDGYAETADGEMAPVVDVWYCSECGHCIDEGIDDETLLPNYCPNCGAKMGKGVQ